MLKQRGFTLIELLMVVAIIGVLTATAVPLYRTLQQRTYGREAVIMAQQIMEAQIMYFLEHNKFWPVEDGSAILITHDTDPADPQITQMKDALKIEIPVGHHLDYSMHVENFTAEGPPRPRVYLDIESNGKFAIFSNASDPYRFQVQVDRTGQITWIISD